MRREQAVIGIIAGMILAASASFTLAQVGASSEATRPGPTPAPSSGMPSDLDTTGAGGTQPGCVAPPSGTASATGGDLRTPPNAGALRSSRTGGEPHGTAGHSTETSEPMPKNSSNAKTSGC